jgi:ABC-type sugar transport system ATPase subunit
LTLGIRPEHVVIGGETNRLEAPVALVESLGSAHFAYLDLVALDGPFACQLPDRPETPPGSLSIALPPARLHLFDGEGIAFAAAPRPATRDAA